MKRLTAALLGALALVALAAHAQADPSEYEIESVKALTSTDQAGGHPDFTNGIKLRFAGGRVPATTRYFSLDLPPGLLANPQAVPTCTAAQLVSTNPEDPSNATGCPQDSQVGVTTVFLSKNEHPEGFTVPIFNLEPRYGEPARLGFVALAYPIVIDTHLRPDDHYGVSATVDGIDSQAALVENEATLWGVPADASHDAERVTAYEAARFLPPQTPSGRRPSGVVPVPYTVNSTACGVARQLKFTVSSYQLPELFREKLAPLAPATGCGLLSFEPVVSAVPTTADAVTGTGLNFELTMPQEGLEHPNLLAPSELKSAEVALPEGMSVNPSEAEGLGVCTEADYARETADSPPNQGCPETSKIGSVTARSPLLDEPAEGSVFLAKPFENPFGSLLAIYMVFKIPDRGVIVKLPGEVESKPQTGQLVTTVEEIPQLPVSSFKLHFREGARAPLVTPPSCGTYETVSRLTPWSDPEHPRPITSSFRITAGVGGGPCPPGGDPPLHPGLSAGTLNNAAGRYSPFDLRLFRSDGEQEITHFSIKLPPGLLGKLAGIPYCPDAAIEAAKSRTGAAEIASPSCPAASEIGRTLAGAGVGSVLAYAPGKVYLAGPYHGAPISMAAITAAKVGPFDLGTVVVREAFKINPETGEVFIDATGSDPLPHIIDGIPTHLRDIRAYVDRSEFVLNPTDCTRTSTASTVLGAGLDFASEADDDPVTVSTPFQAAECAALPFKPRLKLQLKGGTRRGAHPAFKATLKMNGIGEAGIERAQVTLPGSEFIENAHFDTICTRVQFRQGSVPGEQCPAGSIYGHAKAITPILAEPLRGPIFLRSSEHQLPDVVAALHNAQVDVVLDGRVDSVKGRLRNTFEATPDAPVSSVVVELAGGDKSLFVNSTDLCRHTHRAIAAFTGQNGKERDFRPALRANCPRAGKARRGVR